MGSHHAEAVSIAGNQRRASIEPDARLAVHKAAGLKPAPLQANAHASQAPASHPLRSQADDTLAVLDNQAYKQQEWSRLGAGVRKGSEHPMLT